MSLHREDWVCQKGAHLATGESHWVERNTPDAIRLGCHGNVCHSCFTPVEPEVQAAPATPVPYIAHTSRGERVESTLTDAEAYELLRTDPREFPSSLAHSYARYKSWTPNQRPWAHKLALEIQAKKNAPVFDNTFGGATFGAVADKLNGCQLKRLRITFVSADGTFTIERAKTMAQGYALRFQAVAQSGTAGQYLYKKTFGFLKPDGTIQLRGEAPPTFAMATLDELEQDFVATCRAYGQRTNQCCFCSAPLTDEPSVYFGYGPVCARSYALPHGKKDMKADKQHPHGSYQAERWAVVAGV